MRTYKTKTYREQFVECEEEGCLTKTEFRSFKDHPENLPLPGLNQKLDEAIKTGKMTGITVFLCGVFNNGICHSDNAACKQMRGMELI